MTVTGSEPPSFPNVGSSGTNSPSSSGGSPDSPLFTSPDQRGALPPPAIPDATPAPAPARGSRLRWLVAGLATILVLGVVGGVIVLAAPRAGAASEVAHYAPADTAMYGEIRLDLPGDQHQNLATFMSHFPGFADQAAFQQKLDDTLDTLLKDKTNGALDWNNDVKPWFGGQIAVFGTPDLAGPQPAPACPSAAACAQYSGQSNNVAFVLSVSDRALLEAGLSAHLGSLQPTTIDYQGVQIATVAPPSMSGQQVSYAVTDNALIASTNIDLVKEALDVHAGQKPALADDTFFTQQLGQLHSDRLATYYFDASKAIPVMPEPALPVASALPQCMQALQSATRGKAVGELRAESDHLAMTVRSQMASGDNLPPGLQNAQSTLAQSMPADTVAYVETHNLGANLDWLIKQELACASAAGGSGPLPSGLDILGGADTSQVFQQLLGTTPDQFFDFIQDAGLGVTYKDGTFGGGIVATVDDQAVATQRVDKVTALLGMAGTLGGNQGGSGITTEQVNHNGTTITVIHYSTPADGTSPQSGAGSVDLAVATTNGKLYLGLEDFVTAALDQDASKSLASNAGYQKAVSAAPQSNAGIVYVDIPALADAAESSMTSDARQQYEQNVKPFLTPLSSASVVIHVDGDTVVTNGFLYVE